MKQVGLKNIFLFGLTGFIVLTMNLSCGEPSFYLPEDKDIQNQTEDSSGELLYYPSMEYISKIKINGLYGGYEFIENVYVDMDSKNIKMSSKYKNDSFQVIEVHSEKVTKNIKSQVEEKKEIFSEYTRSKVSELYGAEYSYIKALFIFVSGASIDGRRVEFNKPVPLLPRDDVSISSFLDSLKEGISYSYTYKDDRYFSDGVSITTNIQASEGDDDVIEVVLDNTVTTIMSSQDNDSYVADFWMNAIFPKKSTYYIDKDKNIKTIKYDSQLIMSSYSRGESRYFDNENISTQNTETRLCEYKIEEKKQYFDCGF